MLFLLWRICWSGRTDGNSEKLDRHEYRKDPADDYD